MTDEDYADHIEANDKAQAKWEDEQFAAQQAERYDDKIYDDKNNVIEVGNRVKSWDGKYAGTITEITDADGDVDDWGMAIYIAPQVVVEFDDGEIEQFPVSSRVSDDKQICEEVVKI